MLGRIRDYFVSLTVVLTAYLVYAQTVVRLVEPPAIERRTIAQASGVETVRRRHPHAHLFAEGDWELDNPKILETNQGTLLFQEYAPREGGKLEIRPCTLIVFSSAADNQAELSGRPIVLRANQGALLEFQGGVDLARARFGRLNGGRIQGEVRVFSPESTPGAGDELEFLTRNVQIEPQRVWTPHEVEFRYGKSHGSGHDFIMSLAPSEQVAAKQLSVSPFGRVEGLQVTQIRELVLHSQAGGFFPSVKPAAASATVQPPATAKDEFVRITCAGPFKFDAIRGIGTFEDHVLVERQVPEGPPDTLRCDQLGVFFFSTDPTKDTSDSTTPQTPRGIERIVAIGTPVVMESKREQAWSEAERLEYNLQSKQILLKMLNSTGRVKMRHGVDEFTAPELAYELGERGRVGRLWAPGPGRLVSSVGDGPDRRSFTAQWRREIRIRPQQANLVISLMDDARAEVQGQGQFRAGELHLWMLELPGQAASSGSRGLSAGRYLLPDRLLALGQVKIESPQLLASLDRVEVWFEHLPVEKREPLVRSAAPAQPVLQLQPASGPVTPPPPVVAAPPIREPEPAPATADEPLPQFQVVGEIARMQFKLRGQAASLDQLAVEGKQVKVNETNAATGEQPLFMLGTKLELAGGIGRDAVITIHGAPALVTAREMSLRSTQLILNRRDNRLLVEQAGELGLPVRQGFHGEELATTHTLQVSWQGSFVFDGQLARFRRGVAVRGPGYNASADELQASLQRSFSFTDTTHRASNAEFRSLSLLGNVKLDNRTFATDGRQESLEKMETAELQLDRLTGNLTAAGPGWVSLVQPGSPQAGPAEKTASRALPFGADNDSLTYLRVEFRESMRGNLKAGQVDFEDQVQAVFGAVPHWDAEISSASREALGERGAILSTNRLTVARFPSTQPSGVGYEMTALGNTRVEGRSYEALSHRLSFATSKNQLVLEGDGRFDAKIKRSIDNSYLEAQRILFQPDNNALQLDGTRVLSFGPAGATPATQRPPVSPRDVRARQ